MRIAYNDCGIDKARDFAEFIESELGGDDYDRGVMEANTATARNNSLAIGRLLEILMEKELLGVKDVLNIVDSYIDEAELIKETK